MDVRFERDGKSYIAIDTAGVRKRAKLSSDVEFYSPAPRASVRSAARM